MDRGRPWQLVDSVLDPRSAREASDIPTPGDKKWRARSLDSLRGKSPRVRQQWGDLKVRGEMDTCVFVDLSVSRFTAHLAISWAGSGGSAFHRISTRSAPEQGDGEKRLPTNPFTTSTHRSKGDEIARNSDRDAPPKVEIDLEQSSVHGDEQSGGLESYRAIATQPPPRTGRMPDDPFRGKPRCGQGFFYTNYGRWRKSREPITPSCDREDKGKSSAREDLGGDRPLAPSAPADDIDPPTDAAATEKTSPVDPLKTTPATLVATPPARVWRV